MTPFPSKGLSGREVNNLLWRYQGWGSGMLPLSVAISVAEWEDKRYGNYFAVPNPKTWVQLLKEICLDTVFVCPFPPGSYFLALFSCLLPLFSYSLPSVSPLFPRIWKALLRSSSEKPGKARRGSKAVLQHTENRAGETSEGSLHSFCFSFESSIKPVVPLHC